MPISITDGYPYNHTSIVAKIIDEYLNIIDEAVLEILPWVSVERTASESAIHRHYKDPDALNIILDILLFVDYHRAEITLAHYEDDKSGRFSLANPSISTIIIYEIITGMQWVRTTERK